MHSLSSLLPTSPQKPVTAPQSSLQPASTPGSTSITRREANSSYMIEAILQFLVGESKTSKKLLNACVFKVVPMLNPDGVVVGNYRCSLAGYDLNRQWIDPKQSMFPEIYHTKNLIRETQNVVLFCDFHGHSRKKNIFIYGCNAAKKHRERVFPYLLSQRHRSFSYADCCFKVQKSREGTGRVVVCKELNIPNSYTCESSFCGAKESDTHFSPQAYYEFGEKFCETLLEMLNEKKVEETLKGIQGVMEVEMENECGSDSADDEESDVRKSGARKYRRAEELVSKLNKSLPGDVNNAAKKPKIIKRTRI
eukprot:TRINITY_DN9687_c0_g4_i1.p1 TRINITY_DN9687_c0_g4~~TRINITY_DN9687_c0_g4_i1.p1  ORF type:complete len:308 (+),score=55.09 TRINITY_DN9687_c0_g4_i1:768-1691(+)